MGHKYQQQLSDVCKRNKKNSKANVLSSHAVICNKTLNWYTSKF